MPKIRFAAKEGGDFELIPKGTYDFQIIESAEDQAKSGDPQTKMVFEILEGDYAGKKVTQWLSHDEKIGWRLRNLAEACGVDYSVVDESNPDIPVLEIDTDDFLQRIVRAELSHYYNKDKDQTYHNLKKFELSPSNPDYEKLLALQSDEESESQAEAPAAAPAPAPASAPAAQARRRPPSSSAAKA